MSKKSTLILSIQAPPCAHWGIDLLPLPGGPISRWAPWKLCSNPPARCRPRHGAYPSTDPGSCCAATRPRKLGRADLWRAPTRLTGCLRPRASLATPCNRQRQTHRLPSRTAATSSHHPNAKPLCGCGANWQLTPTGPKLYNTTRERHVRSRLAAEQKTRSQLHPMRRTPPPRTSARETAPSGTLPRGASPWHGEIRCA